MFPYPPSRVSSTGEHRPLNRLSPYQLPHPKYSHDLTSQTAYASTPVHFLEYCMYSRESTTVQYYSIEV